MSKILKISLFPIFLVLFLSIFSNKSYAISPIKAPHIQQLPELPRGCEVTSLAMMLQHSGIKVSKMQLAKEVEKVPYKTNGLFGNPYNGFIGNMYTFNAPGLGVYHGPIQDLAEKYLQNRVVNLTGLDFSYVYSMLDKGQPVWVITNSWFKKLPSSQFITWQTSSGPLRITYREHSVLVTGYDSKYIYINDPLYPKANRAVKKQDFIDSWNQMGKQAISYYPKNTDLYIDTMNHWAKDEISLLKQNGIVSGKSPAIFAPNEPITKAQAAVILDRALHVNVANFKKLSFLDVHPTDPSYVPIAKMVQLGYMNKKTTFEPTKPLKREEMAQLFATSFEVNAPEEGIQTFEDVPNSSPFYKYIQSLKGTRLISSGSEFNPEKPVTRAQFASLLAKLLITSGKLS